MTLYESGGHQPGSRPGSGLLVFFHSSSETPGETSSCKMNLEPMTFRHNSYTDMRPWPFLMFMFQLTWVLSSIVSDTSRNSFFFLINYPETRFVFHYFLPEPVCFPRCFVCKNSWFSYVFSCSFVLKLDEPGDPGTLGSAIGTGTSPSGVAEHLRPGAEAKAAAQAGGWGGRRWMLICMI